MKLKKIRNALLVVLTLALVSATAVAVTWALNGTFNTVDNKFENGAITLELQEPAWDGEQPPYNTDGSTNNTPDTDPTDPGLGKNIATKYKANVNIPKDPRLTNTTADITEYVAMTAAFKLSYVEVDATDPTSKTTVTDKVVTKSVFETCVGKLMNNATTPAAGLNTGWAASTVTDNSKTVDVFYYGSLSGDTLTPTVLNAQTQTSVPAFSYVNVNQVEQITSANKGTLADTYLGKYRMKDPDDPDNTIIIDSLPEFDIILKGYAVQADSFDTVNDNVKTELDKLIKADL